MSRVRPKDTKPELKIRSLAHRLGYRYPWVKYDQIVVDDFMYGGMENTTATVLTDRTLHLAKDEPSTSSRGLVAHELAHQWFGDLVSIAKVLIANGVKMLQPDIQGSLEKLRKDLMEQIKKGNR